tara:strand:- start:292 stop:615 length:324 start_codon:yes stop_codon:yes gene_type:complete
MFKGGANMSKLLKQAQKMKDDMEKAQKELGNMKIDVSDSNNMVSIVLDGNKNILSLKLSEDLLSEEKDFIEDILISALNKANKEADLKIKEKMSEATGGIMPNIPGF